jgi:hypothetical protein
LGIGSKDIGRRSAQIAADQKNSAANQREMLINSLMFREIRSLAFYLRVSAQISGYFDFAEC